MMRIVVVEDDPFITTIFSMFIKSLGHQLVAQCKSGQAAIEACRTYRPDIVLMDIHIEGDLDGILTCQLIHGEFDIPVIYVSSETDNHVIEHAITSNSYGYLIKPITKQELGISLDLAYYKHKIDVSHRESKIIENENFSGATSAIVIVNRGHIQFINKYALEVFKATDVEEVLIKPFIEYVGSEIKDEIIQIIEQPFLNSRWVKTINGEMFDIEGNSYGAELTISEVAFGGIRVLQFVISEKLSQVEPITYVNVMKRALMNYPRLCLLLSQDLDIYSYNKVFSNLPIERQVEISNFLFNANLLELCTGKDEVRLPMHTSDGIVWLKVFVARNPTGEPMEYVVIEVD